MSEETAGAEFGGCRSKVIKIGGGGGGLLLKFEEFQYVVTCPQYSVHLTRQLVRTT